MWVIGSHRAGTHDDGIALGTQLVHASACFIASDAPATTRFCCDVAVDGHRQLEHDEWPPGAAMVQIRRKLRANVVCRDADFNLDAGCSKSCDAAAGNARVGVFYADHHTRHTCRDDRLGARWRATEVVARLKRDIHSRAASRVTGTTQRLDFGVCLTDRLCETAEATTVVGNEHCADPRVGSARQSRRGGDKHRLAHRLLVDVAHLFLLPSGL